MRQDLAPSVVPLTDSGSSSSSSSSSAAPQKLLSRRLFLQSSSVGGFAGAISLMYPMHALAHLSTSATTPLKSASTIQPTPLTITESRALSEFSYSAVRLNTCRHQAQFEATLKTLMAISDDNMLKPFRARAGLSAPGDGVGGWYENNPAYDGKKGGDMDGFAPGHCFGQWMSALARAYAITGSEPVLAKLTHLIHEYDLTICKEFYEEFRFPAYTYDKLVCGLLDAYELAGVKEALPVLQRTTEAALPNLPQQALERGEPLPAHPDRDASFRWDESYTLPENLFRAYELGCGEQYRELANRFLLDKTFFIPLSTGQNPLSGKHAYSYMNALSSAMRAHLVLDSQLHLEAAKNALDIIHAQSYVTGGWGPDETFVQPGAGSLGKSLTGTHHSFETCGGYAHMKLTRYLLRTTKDARYGDSMERVIQNTVLGVKGMEPNGNTFYYSDYNNNGHKDFYWMKCPCCAGTLPQIVADYRICTYLQAKNGLYVNLYIPSTLSWKQGNCHLSLTQHSEYPLEGRINLKVTASRPESFDIRLRIPEWAGPGVEIRVNGKSVHQKITPGTFASLNRTWRNNDTITLDLPLPLSLKPVDPEHPEVLALSYGALALFAVHQNDSYTPKATRDELLTATRNPAKRDEWLVKAASGTISFMPFTSIGDERYSAYINTLEA